MPAPLVGLILLVVGLPSLVRGLWAWRHARARRRASRVVEGQVIALETNEDGAAPVVRVALAGNAPVTFTSRLRCSPPMHRVGETVAVVHDTTEGTLVLQSERRMDTGFQVGFELVFGMPLTLLGLAILAFSIVAWMVDGQLPVIPVSND